MNKALIMRFGFILIIVGLLLAIYFAVNPSQPSKPIACTMEARECPGGSFVSRTGPNCEFAECPAVTSTTPVIREVATSTVPKQRNATYKNEKFGFSFVYPVGSTITTPALSSSMKDAVKIVLPKSATAYSNMSAVFGVYEKGTYLQYSEADMCALFSKEVMHVQGVTFNVIESDHCKDQEGRSPTHFLRAVIPLSDSLDLVYDNADLSARGPEALSKAKEMLNTLAL